jgi:hypothetical protein
MDVERTIWMVDDSREFRDLSDTVAAELRIAIITMGTAELAERRQTHDLPDGVLADSAVLSAPHAERLLEGIPRIVICTAKRYGEIPVEWETHLNVRVLLKPMQLADFESAIQWLAGDRDGTSWPTDPELPSS